MCGICGIVSSENLRENDFSLVSVMNDSMVHRGPDDSGQFRDDNVILAMRRLSIIDLAGGKQPLANEDNSIVLVANGEIYNYIELMAQLQSNGHKFQTHSDCETIIHLYEESGVECLEKLRGMFAFALWDKRKKQLFIARDRIGEKPLYLWQQNGRLIFASELRTLIKALPSSPSLDLAGIDMFMHYQYVPEPMTIVKDIKKLEAGHFILIKPAPWQITAKRYWNIESAPPITDSNPPQRILQELQDVTSLTLRSDVPVGIALSGGIDSNAIAALSAPKYKDQLHAFTVGYEGRPECDERNRAKLIADEFNLPFHEIEITTESFINSFAELVFSSDDPIADVAAFGYFAVLKEARKHQVPVMLTGFGGDELFWGYPWVVESLIENTRRLSLLGNGPEARARLARELTFYERHYDFKTAEQVLPILYTSSFKQNIPPQNSFRPFRIDEPYDSLPVRICRALFDNWLVSNCIVLGDRLSMASSVELRLPLLDYKLVELVMGLRKTYKTDYTLEPKIWLKEAVRNILPERVMNYPKRGFTPPVKKWFSAAIEHYGHLLTDGCLVKDKIIDPDRLQHLLAQPIGGGPLLHFVYKLLVLEMWSRSVLGDQISLLPRSHYEKQNQRVENRLTENKLALFAEELVKKAVHLLKQGRESEALDYFDVGARLRPELTQQKCQQAMEPLDENTLSRICSEARRKTATVQKHLGASLLLKNAQDRLDRMQEATKGCVENCQSKTQHQYTANKYTCKNPEKNESRIEKYLPEILSHNGDDKCLKMQVIGTEYGGWAVDLDLIPFGSTVISAGVGEDISFDLGLINLTNCRVIGIDPTEKAKRYVEKNRNERFHFLQKALYSESNKKIKIYKSNNPDWVSESIVPSHHTITPSRFHEAETISLQDLLKVHKDVSILKMDIEGAEYEVLNSISKLDIPQICVEFHHFCTDFTVDDTEKCIEHLSRMGYVLAHCTSECGAIKEATFVHRKYIGNRDTTQMNVNDPKALITALDTSQIGLFAEDPQEIIEAKELIKLYYKKRLKDIWFRPDHPVWFDHEIDYHLWPDHVFWIERGVFGRIVMKPRCRVLDLCCGDGYYSDVWYSTIAATIDACDNNRDALRFASLKHSNPKIKYYCIDILQEPFPSPKYDVVTWFGAIEHFTEEQIIFLLTKIKASMDEGGMLVGSTPLLAERTVAGKKEDNRQHEREFASTDDLEGVLRKVFAKIQLFVSNHANRRICNFRAVNVV